MSTPSGWPTNPRVKIKRMPTMRAQVLQDIGRKAALWTKKRWSKEASQSIQWNLPEYFYGMDVKYSRGNLIMKLSGGRRGRYDFQLPVALERGQASFDLRPGFLGGAKSQSPIGRKRGAHLPRAYRRIPLDPFYSRSGQRFATISVHSAPGTWIHPGIKARNIMERVVDSVYAELVPQIKEEFLAAFRGEMR